MDLIGNCGRRLVEPSVRRFGVHGEDEIPDHRAWGHHNYLQTGRGLSERIACQEKVRELRHAIVDCELKIYNPADLDGRQVHVVDAKAHVSIPTARGEEHWEGRFSWGIRCQL